MKTLELSPRRAVAKHRRVRRSSDRMITDVDRRRLGTLISTREGRAWGTTQSMGQLETLLEDALPVVAADAPETLVTMNATVELVDVDSGARRCLTVVHPQDADDVPNAASIVTPLGLALIGCQVGDVLQCPGEPDHVLRIAEIVDQPERTGTRYL
jgi:regulator of nucleoside diphosphate kinase